MKFSFFPAAFMWAFLTPFAGAVPQYTVTPLMPLDDSGVGAYSYALDAAGLPVGSGTVVLVGQRACRFEGGSITDLGVVAGFPSSEALGVSVDGTQIAGRLYLNAASQERAFRFSGGVLLELGTLGGGDSSAAGVNDSGVVVGRASLSSNPNDPQFPDVEFSHAFRFDPSVGANGTMFDLGTLGGKSSEAIAINNAGIIVGRSNLAAGGDAAFRAFLWDGATMHDLGSLGAAGSGARSEARAINQDGVAAGSSELTLGGEIHPCIFELDGTITDLGTLVISGDTWTQGTAVGINQQRQVVGAFFINTGYGMAFRPFLYSDGQLHDLNDFLLPNSDWFITNVSAINDAGQILARGSRIGVNGGRPVLLTPVTASPTPTPSVTPTVTPTPTPTPTPMPTPVPQVTPTPYAGSPTLTIAGKKKLTTTAAKAVVKGTTAGVVTSVTYRIGKKGKWKLAHGTRHWKLTVKKLQPGRNELTVIAYGSGGASASLNVTIVRK